MTRFYDMFPDRWLKAALLEGQPRTVKIRAVTCESFLKPNGKTENAWLLGLEKIDKELSLNKTNSRLLFAMLGEDTDDWIGHWVTLAPEEDDSGKSDDGFCIRVVGSPEIKTSMEVMVKGPFGKKYMRVVRPTGKNFDEDSPATINDTQLAIIKAWVAEKGKSLAGLSTWLAKKGLHDGPIETLPLSVFEQVIGEEAAGGNGATSVKASEAQAKAEIAAPPTDELDQTPAEPADESTEASDQGVVTVIWPGGGAPISQEIGERTRYGELIAHYLTSTGHKDAPEDYAVFDDAGNECGPREVIPATVWGRTFTVVALEAAQPAAAPAPENGKGRKTKAKKDAEPAPAAADPDEAADADFDRLGSVDLETPPDSNSVKKNTLTSLAMTCADLEKAGWTEQSWRGVMSALTGGVRSRKELTEAEAKNVLASLRYELEQLAAKGS